MYIKRSITNVHKEATEIRYRIMYTFLQLYYLSWLRQKDTIGGRNETLENVLQVTPLFVHDLVFGWYKLDVTTTTAENNMTKCCMIYLNNYQIKANVAMNFIYFKCSTRCAYNISCNLLNVLMCTSCSLLFIVPTA